MRGLNNVAVILYASFLLQYMYNKVCTHAGGSKTSNNKVFISCSLVLQRPICCRWCSSGSLKAATASVIPLHCQIVHSD